MNSALNPEAPEFYPHLTSVTQISLIDQDIQHQHNMAKNFYMYFFAWGGYSTVNKTIRSSNQLPIGASYELFKTYTDFNIVTRQISENVVAQSNQILTTELPAVKLKCNDHEYNTDKITDANDCMLDRVNINIDTVSGVNKPSDKFLDGVKAGVNISSWNKNNNAPVIAKIQVGSTTFIGAKNIPRPQIAFKDTIDNSESLWVPKISDKPNNIKPLALNILYNDESEAVGYEHPYKVELDLYQPPSEALAPDPAPPRFPPPLEHTPYTFVNTDHLLNELVAHLNTVTEMAVDLEHHSYRTYQGITCLIQITTTDGGDFIIDALAIREHIHKLNQAFTDPKKIKVFHGSEMDVLWLQRDFGVYVVGLFDTHQAAKVLKTNGLSLKYLLLKYCRVDADKKYQLADWRMRPLPDELIEYARMDTHYLLYIWRSMKAELLELGAGQPHLLLSVFEQSRQICGTTYNKEVIHDKSHMPLYVRSKKSFNSRQMAALQLLYKWRDAQARLLDESTTYLLPNHMLLSLAETLPREVQGVNACCSPMPPFVKQNLIAIHRMLLSCRELPLEPQLYQTPTSIMTMVNTHHNAYEVHDYSHFPDFREDQCINLDRAAVFLEDFNNFQPDINIFVSNFNSEANYGVISDLNADAKLFIPPYDRYRKYRSLAQLEEIKEFKEKEAKIAAISKGNELIKTEVLQKMRQVKSQVQVDNELDKVNDITNSEKIPEKRKRKMSAEKIEHKDPVPEVIKNIDPEPKNIKNKTETSKNVKSFRYQNINYRKFYDETDKAHKQPKTKFKKHK